MVPALSTMGPGVNDHWTRTYITTMGPDLKKRFAMSTGTHTHLTGWQRPCDLNSHHHHNTRTQPQVHHVHHCTGTIPNRGSPWYQLSMPWYQVSTTMRQELTTRPWDQNSTTGSPWYRPSPPWYQVSSIMRPELTSFHNSRTQPQVYHFQPGTGTLRHGTGCQRPCDQN